MLIGLRNKAGDLRVRDILDINIDMRVEQTAEGFLVRMNRQYYLDEKFSTRKNAENAIYNIANIRNEMEEM